MKPKPGAICLIPFSLLLLQACTAAYDFRDADRPVHEQAVSVADISALQNAGATVLDVRLLEDFEAEPVLIPGARYANPDNIEQWAAAMTPRDGPLVVYCVRGKWVSQKAARYLQNRGFEVYSLEGGIKAWQDEGRPLARPD